MKPVKTENTNFTLLHPDGHEEVMDLPVTRVEFTDGTIGVESCWELTEAEKAEILKTGRMYFVALAPTHAPICLSAYSVLDPRNNEEGEKANEGN